MVVVAGGEKYEKDGDVLRDLHACTDVRYDIVAVVRAEHRAAVGEEEIARRGVDEMYEVENVQIDIRRNAAVHQPAEKRHEREADDEYGGADAAVDLALELEVGAYQLAVVVGDRLVH